MKLISKITSNPLLKKVIVWILTIIVIASFNSQNAFAHTPDFEVKTTEDILKFCEFFYEEYRLLGMDDLIDQHSQFPNLRACGILYNHVAWKSTHELRNIVLLAEIEKYLGSSSYIKERHIESSAIIPDWVKREARLWANDENQDMGFAFVIRTMLESGILELNKIERNCEENTICLKEGDFIKYSHYDKYGNNITIKHTVKSINNNEIILYIEKISDDGITKEQKSVDRKGLYKSDECCNYYEFVIPIPLSLGKKISDDIKIVSETTYTFENKEIKSWFATDLTGQNTKIIEQKTGLVFEYEYHQTKVLTVGEKTKITNTNFFDTKYNLETHETVIPKWWKKTTVWLLDGKISDIEYLQAMKNLISRNILRV